MASVSQEVLAIVGAESKPTLLCWLPRGDAWDGGRTLKAADGSPLAPLHSLDIPLPIWQERCSHCTSRPEHPTPSPSPIL